jgi:hypothetical protein
LGRQDFAGALARVEEVLAREPQHAEALSLKGRAEALLDRQRKTTALMTGAQTLLEKGQLQNAAATVDEIDETDPNATGLNTLRKAVEAALAADAAARARRDVDQAAEAARAATAAARTTEPPAAPLLDVTVQLKRPVTPPVAPPPVDPPPVVAAAPPILAVEPSRAIPKIPQIRPAPQVGAPGLSKGLLIGIGAAIVIAIAAGLMVFRSPKEQEAVVVAPVAPPVEAAAGAAVGAAAGATAAVVLDIAPWAKIDSVTNMGDHTLVAIGDAVTPTVLMLTQGDYHVRASNPNFPSPLEFDVTVAAGGGRQDVHQTMPGFQPEQEIDRILNP